MRLLESLKRKLGLKMKPEYYCSVIVNEDLELLSQLSQRGLKEFFDYQINKTDRCALVDGFGLDSAPIALNKENAVLLDSVAVDPFILSFRNISELQEAVGNKVVGNKFSAFQPQVVQEIIESTPELIKGFQVVVIKKPIGRKHFSDSAWITEYLMKRSTQTHEYENFTIFEHYEKEK